MLGFYLTIFYFFGLSGINFAYIIIFSISFIVGISEKGSQIIETKFLGLTIEKGNTNDFVLFLEYLDKLSKDAMQSNSSQNILKLFSCLNSIEKGLHLKKNLDDSSSSFKNGKIDFKTRELIKKCFNIMLKQKSGNIISEESAFKFFSFLNLQNLNPIFSSRKIFSFLYKNRTIAKSEISEFKALCINFNSTQQIWRKRIEELKLLKKSSKNQDEKLEMLTLTYIDFEEYKLRTIKKLQNLLQAKINFWEKLMKENQKIEQIFKNGCELSNKIIEFNKDQKVLTDNLYKISEDYKNHLLFIKIQSIIRLIVFSDMEDCINYERKIFEARTKQNSNIFLNYDLIMKDVSSMNVSLLHSGRMSGQIPGKIAKMFGYENGNEMKLIENVNNLLPKGFAKIHKKLIRSYSKGKFQKNNFSKNAFAKTKEGFLICLKIYLQISFSLQNDFGVVLTIRPSQMPIWFFVFGISGNIDGISRPQFDELNIPDYDLTHFLLKMNIISLFPNLFDNFDEDMIKKLPHGHHLILNNLRTSMIQPYSFIDYFKYLSESQGNQSDNNASSNRTKKYNDSTRKSQYENSINQSLVFNKIKKQTLKTFIESSPSQIEKSWDVILDLKLDVFKFQNFEECYFLLEIHSLTPKLKNLSKDLKISENKESEVRLLSPNSLDLDSLNLRFDRNYLTFQKSLSETKDLIIENHQESLEFEKIESLKKQNQTILFTEQNIDKQREVSFDIDSESKVEDEKRQESVKTDKTVAKSNAKYILKEYVLKNWKPSLLIKIQLFSILKIVICLIMISLLLQLVLQQIDFYTTIIVKLGVPFAIRNTYAVYTLASIPMILHENKVISDQAYNQIFPEMQEMILRGKNQILDYAKLEIGNNTYQDIMRPIPLAFSNELKLENKTNYISIMMERFSQDIQYSNGSYNKDLFYDFFNNYYSVMSDCIEHANDEFNEGLKGREKAMQGIIILAIIGLGIHFTFSVILFPFLMKFSLFCEKILNIVGRMSEKEILKEISFSEQILNLLDDEHDSYLTTKFSSQIQEKVSGIKKTKIDRTKIFAKMDKSKVSTSFVTSRLRITKLPIRFYAMISCVIVIAFAIFYVFLLGLEPLFDAKSKTAFDLRNKISQIYDGIVITQSGIFISLISQTLKFPPNLDNSKVLEMFHIFNDPLNVNALETMNFFVHNSDLSSSQKQTCQNFFQIDMCLVFSEVACPSYYSVASHGYESYISYILEQNSFFLTLLKKKDFQTPKQLAEVLNDIYVYNYFSSLNLATKLITKFTGIVKLFAKTILDDIRQVISLLIGIGGGLLLLTYIICLYFLNSKILKRYNQMKTLILCIPINKLSEDTTIHLLKKVLKF